MPAFLEFKPTENETKTITFIITKFMGKGATSYCYKGYQIDDPLKKDYAIKIYNQNILSAFYSETSLMSSIKNETFLSLYYKGKGLVYKKSEKNKSFNENKAQKSSVYFAIIELAENHELFDYIFYPKRGFSEKQAAEIFFKIVSAIKVLHSKKIAHCDIKPENVLIDNDFNIKLIDFGYSSLSGDENNNETRNMIYVFQSTDIYGSPEAKKSDENNGYDPIKHDLFSLGIFLFVIVLGCFPYTEYSLLDRRYFCIVNDDFDTFWKSFNKFTVSCNFKDLINKLICYDPNKRLSVSEILEHPWMKLNLEINKENNEKSDFKNELIKRKEIVDRLYNQNDKN